MTRPTKDFLNVSLGTLAFVLLLGIAGRCDQDDATICEMKNNGAYWRLSEEHPSWSDSRLVEYYDSLADDTWAH